MPARIDHVVVAVKDSEAAASLLFSKYGLQSYSGGIHPVRPTRRLLLLSQSVFCSKPFIVAGMGPQTPLSEA